MRNTKGNFCVLLVILYVLYLIEKVKKNSVLYLIVFVLGLVKIYLDIEIYVAGYIGRNKKVIHYHIVCDDAIGLLTGH